MDMNVIFVLLVKAAIVGAVIYLFNLLPIDAIVKKVFTVLVLILVIVWSMGWVLHHVGG